MAPSPGDLPYVLQHGPRPIRGDAVVFTSGRYLCGLFITVTCLAVMAAPAYAVPATADRAGAVNDRPRRSSTADSCTNDTTTFYEDDWHKA
jgi:hypothetical protein